MKKYAETEIGHDSLLYIEKARSNPRYPQEAPDGTKPEFNVVGAYTPRIDGERIVTGRAPYTHDIKLRGMLIARILRSPHASARIQSVDLSRAKNLPGVKAAIRLADDSVSYAGQQVAAVAAIDEATAEKAIRLIDVQYEPRPHVVREEEARKEDAPQVRDGRPNVDQFNDYSRGDVEKGLQEADAVLERTYKTAIEIHHPTETHSSIALWEGNHVTIWDSTQAVHSVRNGVARQLGIPSPRVEVIKHYMGGGFGSKLGWNDYTVAAARLSKETGKPVKVALNRQENSECVGNRPSSMQTYKGGIKKDGTLTALALTNYTSGGIRSGDRCSEPLIDIYKCANVRADEYSVYINTGAARPTRAPGHVQGTFGLDGFLDELANEIDMDPLELRRKNYTTKNRGGTGIPYSSKGLDKCYTLGAEAIGWNRRNKEPGQGSGPFRRGIGMASQIWWGSGVPGTLADVMLYPDGSVEVTCGTQDIGCGTRTHMAVVAADTLGLKPEEIIIRLGSSDYPWAPVSGGSLTTPSVAPAVRDASLKAAAYLKTIAAEKLEVNESEIILGNRKLLVKENPDKSVSFKDVMGELSRETVFHGERKGMPQDYAFNSFGAHFAEVEVDMDIGNIRVIKFVAAHDVGQVINKQTAESQVIGGVTQGISAALFEQRIMDSTTGRLVNPNLRDYKIATALDMPEIIPIFVDIYDHRISNIGAKGLGEPPRIPSSAAIGNAVYNAIGVHVREIPMTPDRVLRSLKNKEAGQ